MKPILRKVFIALFCFVAVLAFYLLIKAPGTKDHVRPALLSQTGGKAGLVDKSIIDGNDSAIDGNEIGQIGNVGFGNVEVARFTNFGKDGTVNREFGFKTLLHKTANRWEIEQPFMNIYQDRLTCYITADIGDVLLDEGAERPVPRDVTLTGNVVIHIVPEQPGKLDEAYVYLDDVTFFSSSSRFTTAGPVRYVAEKAQLTGKGLEIIYNAEKDKLEVLRLSRLDSLIVKTPSQQASFFAAKKTAGDTRKKPPVERQKAVTEINEPARPAAPVQTTMVSSLPPQGTYYKCAFSKNVLIESPGQLVLTDRFVINNILWKKGSAPAGNRASETSIKPEPAAVETRPVKAARPQYAAEQNTRTAAEKSALRVAGIAGGKNTGPHPEKNEQQFVDIIINCDNGLLVLPMDSKKSFDDFPVQQDGAQNASEKASKKISPADTTAGRRLTAERIDYDVSTQNTSTSGFCEILFYTKDPIEQDKDVADMPVTVTSYTQAQYIPAEKTVLFEGDCLFKMLRTHLGVLNKYGLSAPRIIVKLSETKNADFGDSITGIEHLTATGGLVQLDSSRFKDDKLLGFTKLKCLQFDYDSKEKTCLAAGPDGIIAVDNSRAPKPKRKTPTFSLQRPCYAVVQGFDTLKYVIPENRILAGAVDERIVVDYFPVINGRPGPKATASAANVEAVFTQRKRRSFLSYLVATGGVDYEDADKKLAGSKLIYDNRASLIRVLGDLYQPCMLNGIMVPEIKYNLKKGRITTKISAPGTLRIKR